MNCYQVASSVGQKTHSQEHTLLFPSYLILQIKNQPNLPLTKSYQVRMLIHEGLQCGFRQEAVSIDPEEGTFVPLGDVAKSLIVTPDVERAFVFS